jgi:hypothetical protein
MLGYWPIECSKWPVKHGNTSKLRAKQCTARTERYAYNGIEMSNSNSNSNSNRYREPPLIKTYFGHAALICLIGFLLPKGVDSNWLHGLMWPIVSLIPNAVRLTNRCVDPVFAQTLMGLSLLLSVLIIVFYIVAMRGYHTKAFESKFKRRWALIYVWSFVLLILTIFWVVPFIDPLSHGRAYFLLLGATSSYFGIMSVMNQLLVGGPLLGLLMLWSAHSCTTTGFNKLTHTI